MERQSRIAILSDVHDAGPRERQRGNDYEYKDLTSPYQRAVCRFYRRFLWLRNPLEHNSLLEDFLARVGDRDHVFALGDYCCDSAFVGISDDAALESANECLGALRRRFGTRLHALIGDHDLGKFPLFGERGGLRFESWRRAQKDLGLVPFWRVEIGHYLFIGITSTLLMLPAFSGEILENERRDWEVARTAHLEEIRKEFRALSSQQRVILLCHDPSALPYLWEESAIRTRVDQIERTVVGHLHSPFIMWNSRRLAGMPAVSFLGHTINRLSNALRRARRWQPFKVDLCPSLAGIELLKDGGFYTDEIDATNHRPFTPVRHWLPR